MFWIVDYPSAPGNGRYAAAETKTHAGKDEGDEHQNNRKVVAEGGTKIVALLRLFVLTEKRVHSTSYYYETITTQSNTESIVLCFVFCMSSRRLAPFPFHSPARAHSCVFRHVAGYGTQQEGTNCVHKQSQMCLATK